MKITGYLLIVLTVAACNGPGKGPGPETDAGITTVYTDTDNPTVAADSPQLPREIRAPVQHLPQPITGIERQELVGFAKTLIGTPYKYASTDPSIGFDCSGFITYVFNHFNIAVPRSSVDFTNVGIPVSIQNATEGDLILFTGTNDSIRIVGHMGIITANADTLQFIHSSSGKANGVVVSGLSDYYKKRFVKVIRVFKD